MAADPLQAPAPPARLLLLNALKAWPAMVNSIGHARMGLRKPTQVTGGLWLECRAANGAAISAGHGAWSRLVQPVICCAEDTVGDELAELACERVATATATYLDRLPAQLHDGTGWRPRVLSGPLDLTDTLRGADTPVHRQALLVDVRMHSPT